MIDHNAVYFPVVVNDQALSELILYLHFELLFVMDEPCALNNLNYDSLWAIILTKEGKIVNDFIFVGLLGPL